MLADEYDILFAIYSNEVLELQRSGGLGDLGNIKWSIALCLLAVFVIVYFSLWKGIKSSGKVQSYINFLTDQLDTPYHIMVIHSCSLCNDWVKTFELRRSDNYSDEHCNSVKITDVQLTQGGQSHILSATHDSKCLSSHYFVVDLRLCY